MKDLKNRPKNSKKYDSPHVFSSFVYQFMDRNIWGFNKGMLRDEKHKRLKAETINQRRKDKTYYEKYKILKNQLEQNPNDEYLKEGTDKALKRHFAYKDGHKVRRKHIITHLNAKKKEEYVYYVNSPDKEIHLFCFDIDSKANTTLDDICNVLVFLRSIFPECYFDFGSSGKSIHFYIFVYISQKYRQEYVKHFSSYSKFCNWVTKNIGDNLASLINPISQMEFDAVKSTLTNYYTNGDICGCGTLCKLPCPRSEGEFELLYNAPVYRLSIDNNYINLNSELLTFFSPISRTFSSSKKSNHPVSMETSSIDGVKQVPPMPSSTLIPLNKKNLNTAPSYIPLPLLIPTTTVLGSKPNYYFKNKGLIKDKDIVENIRNISDSKEREKEYGFYYFTKYYKKHKTIPVFEDYEYNYRFDTGYNKIDEERIIRLKNTYDFMVRYFKPDKIKGKREPGIYFRNDYTDNLKKLITEEEILKIKKNWKGKISYEDISIAAGFYFVSLTRLLKQKEFSDKELTSAQNNMIQWFKSLNDKYETSRTCTSGSKVTILRKILIHVGWLKCVDRSYNSGKRSRRHILTPNFPRYNEFVELVGVSCINKWQNISENQQNVDVRRKVG